MTPEQYADKRLQEVRPDIAETSYHRKTKMGIQVFDGSDIEQAFEDGKEEGMEVGKECILVPLEIIPEQMNIEQFVEAWKNQEPGVIEIVNTKCKKITLE